MEKKKTGISMAGVGCLMTALCVMLFCGCGSRADSLVVDEGEAGAGRMREAQDQDRDYSGESQDGSREYSREAQDGDVADDPAAQIYVQVSGAVNAPGVYQLPAESRVFMAIELAGGLSPEADESSLNQAESLQDGQQIYVCAVGEQARQETVPESDGRVNLNTATAEELMTLPGIGQSKADSIISYRESNGGFGAVEDLMKIEGIKEGVYSKIKDRIKV